MQLVVLMWYHVLVFYISRAFVYWNQLSHLSCYHPIIYQPFLQVTLLLFSERLGESPATSNIITLIPIASFNFMSTHTTSCALLYICMNYMSHQCAWLEHEDSRTWYNVPLQSIQEFIVSCVYWAQELYKLRLIGKGSGSHFCWVHSWDTLALDFHSSHPRS